ncbi:hypothetical protein G7085_18730 [Tessaracoccus sp. HDW20]|nr:hypothetical protein [Tessaracoccus coleopterorum]
MTSEQGDERATQLEVARRIALDQLTVRQRSEEELRQAMARRNVPADIAAEILERFGEVGLIDDASFARALTESRSRHSLRARPASGRNCGRRGRPRDRGGGPRGARSGGRVCGGPRTGQAQGACHELTRTPRGTQAPRRDACAQGLLRGVVSSVVSAVTGEIRLSFPQGSNRLRPRSQDPA